MKAFIVIATKGRPKETCELVNTLQNQSYGIAHIVVVGSEETDIEGVSAVAVKPDQLTVTTSAAGLTIQRNAGLDEIRDNHAAGLDPNDWFVIFIDDDFRMHPDWIASCASAFKNKPNMIGAGGRVLADGITGVGISESEAAQYLNKLLPPEKHHWSGDQVREVEDLYGCNMAYRGTFALNERFDENLPFYGWLEDVDYSVRAAKQGGLYYLPNAIGVHLGVTGGRTSGVRFGYSQIANPTYMRQKNTIAKQKAILLMSRNIISNIVRTLIFDHKKDYRGRLYGNLLAFIDTIKKRCHPLNIKTLKS